MGVEYHGWVALATSQEDWSNGDFDRAFAEVKGKVELLARERGHDPAMPDSDTLPRKVYLNAGDSESAAPAVRLLEEIGEIFDGAYGELVMFHDREGPTRCWDFSVVSRYRLANGRVTKEES